jgi:uncharacterized protein YkwD
MRRALLAVSLLMLAPAPAAGARAARHRATLRARPAQKAVPARRHRRRCAPTGAGSRGPRRSCGAGRIGRPHATRRSRLVPRVATRAEKTVSSTASIIAGVLATPCPNTELVPEAGNVALVSAAVLCLINKERAQHGETPLSPDAQLEAAAQAHVGDMIANDYFEHVSPNGSTPVDRARSVGYLPSGPAGYVIGENLAWGTYSLATAQSIVSAWIASPGHLANILEGSYRDTGIAIDAEVPASLSDDSPGATYAQEFGVITE